MYIDKIIKREFYALLVCIIVLVVFTLCICYFYFFKVDNNTNVNDIINTDDINISICNDIYCNEKYTNNEIGTTIINGISNVVKINSYEKDNDAINEKPYIINISNIGSMNLITNITLTCVDNETNNELVNASTLYMDFIKIGISSCNEIINRENINIYNYSKLNNNVILNDVLLNSGMNDTYCIWTWIDKSKLNNVVDSYFIGKIGINDTYKQKNEF